MSTVSFLICLIYDENYSSVLKKIVVFWCRGRAQSPNDVIEKAGWRLNDTLTDCAT